MLNKNQITIPSERPRRSAMISVRLTRQEQRRIHDFAQQHNVQVSKLVRHFVLKTIQYHTERRDDEKT